MQPSDVRTTIQELWHGLASRPSLRAVMVARIASHHGDSDTRAWTQQLIEQGTPLCEEKREALAYLTPATPLPEIHIDWTDYTVRADPELGRLAIFLNLAAGFRLWVIGRDLGKERDAEGRVVGSSGNLSRTALKQHLRAIGIGYSADHLNRLIRGGEGLFWNASRTHLYFRKPSHVAERLVAQAGEAHPHAIATNLPGVRDVHLSPLGSLEQWEATLYAGWHTHREHPTIARETLSQLFGRREQTLRNWEQRRLQSVVTPRTNYVQAVMDDALYGVFPDYSRCYATKSGDIRMTWRLPNTYFTQGIVQHPHKGQAFKVRKAVRQCLRCSIPTGGMQGSEERPAIIVRSPEHPTGKLYFDGEKRLQRYVRKHGGVRYLWRGERSYIRTRHGIFEATMTGWAETRLWERLGFKDERAFFQAIEARKQAYLMRIS